MISSLPWLNNVVCATSKVSDQPAHTRSLIRDFASRLNFLKAKSQTREFPTGQQLNPIWPMGWAYQLSV